MVKRIPLWRSTPPAIFPLALGFLGISFAWRNAANVLPIPSGIGDLMLGISTAFFAFFALSYLAKTLARPKAVLEDMKIPPARAGVAALPMALMLLAAALLHFDMKTDVIWFAGVLLFYLAMALVIYAIATGPTESRKFSPFQYLSFVGPIVAPIAGVSLGYVSISYWMMLTALLPYVAITLGYGAKLLRVRPPLPLRPSIVIVLAPTSLFAMAFYQFDILWAYTVFYWLSVGLAFAFLVLGMWLTAGGYTPVWGSFTFPIAAFTNLQILTLSTGQNTLATTLNIAGLLIGTSMTLYVVWKSSQLWMRRDLAKNTGASVA